MDLLSVAKVESANLPDKISCRVTGGTDDAGQPIPAQLDFNRSVTDINSLRGPLNDGHRDDIGVILDDNKESLTFDFGVAAHGGDQYYSVTLKRSDLTALSSGEKPLVPGKLMPAMNMTGPTSTTSSWSARSKAADSPPRILEGSFPLWELPFYFIW